MNSTGLRKPSSRWLLKNSPWRVARTQATISILNQKRAEVMAVDQAGYFISTWQDLSGKVREAIAADPRYQAIKAGREVRRRLTKP